MQCPKCQNRGSRVVQTYKMSDSIVRLRRCPICQIKYFTTEKKDRSSDSINQTQDKTSQSNS